MVNRVKLVWIAHPLLLDHILSVTGVIFKLRPRASLGHNVCGQFCRSVCHSVCCSVSLSVSGRNQNAKFQLAVCGKYSGNSWKTLINKFWRLSNNHSMSKIPWTTCDSILVFPRSNYTRSLCIDFIRNSFYTLQSLS